MTLSKDQHEALQEAKRSRDWENFHVMFDSILIERLMAVDKEFMDDMGKVLEGATLWYS